jgi:ribosomal-protein-alanine N-acetyltransferase
MVSIQNLPVRVEPMTVGDLGDVLTIERMSYPSPWSARAYEYELRYNEMAHYFVARLQLPSPAAHSNGGMFERLKRMFRPPPPNGTVPMVVGYVGYWLMAGEAHISTIAVRPDMRGRAYGEFLLATVLEDASARGAHVATLEVRVSNHTAQQLYLKYGFENVGLRKAYYSDNNEDAYIMTTPPLNSGQYREKLEQLTSALYRRLAQPVGSVIRRA